MAIWNGPSERGPWLYFYKNRIKQVCVCSVWSEKRNYTWKWDWRRKLSSNNSTGPKVLIVAQENNSKYFLTLTNAWKGRKQLGGALSGYERGLEKLSALAIIMFLKRVQIPLKQISHAHCPGTQAHWPVLSHLWEPQGERPRKDARILALGGPDCPPSHNADGKIKSQWDESGDS